MTYYFPSFLLSAKLPDQVNKNLVCTISSGKNALRLILRSFNMQAGSKVAIPAFVCPAVKEAVVAEGFEPVLLDLKSNLTFWTDNNLADHIKSEVKALILVHLYGFVHPDTHAVIGFCKENNINLVHDAAQSYGIDEAELGENPLVIYSFGPGKSSTAAGGGWVKGIDEKYYRKTVSPKYTKADEWRAELFLKSRIYGYELSLSDKLKKKVAGSPKEKKQFQAMTSFQRRAASQALNELAGVSRQRNANYMTLASAVEKSNNLYIPYNNGKTSCFKLIVGVKADPGRFAAYLDKDMVPYFRLFTEKETKNSSLPNFTRNAGAFFELSCEASLPQEEIARVAGLLAYY